MVPAARRAAAELATLRYRRRLQRSDGHNYRPLTVAEDAATCARLMDHVGWPIAHVVGHSYGALVALQMAIHAPARFVRLRYSSPQPEESPAQHRSLPPCSRSSPPTSPVTSQVQSTSSCATSAATATATFWMRWCRAPSTKQLDEADLFFQAELSAVRQWSFGPDDAERVTQPVLNVGGADSVPRFVQASELVQSWFPEAERLTVPGAGHLLMVAEPGRNRRRTGRLLRPPSDRPGGHSVMTTAFADASAAARCSP